MPARRCSSIVIDSIQTFEKKISSPSHEPSLGHMSTLAQRPPTSVSVTKTTSDNTGVGFEDHNRQKNPRTGKRRAP